MMIQITEGVLKGALEAEGFTDIESCIQDVESFVSDSHKAISDFEKKSAKGVIDGLKEVAQMYKVAKDGMHECSKGKADWDKLDAMIKEWSSPWSFAYHVGHDLVVNGKDIYKEVDSSITAYKAKDWYNFGVDIGEASAKTFLGSKNELGSCQPKPGFGTATLCIEHFDPSKCNSDVKNECVWVGPLPSGKCEPEPGYGTMTLCMEYDDAKDCNHDTRNHCVWVNRDTSIFLQ